MSRCVEPFWGQPRELTLETNSLPNGERIGRPQVDTPHDAALLASVLGLCPPSSNERSQWIKQRD